HREVLPPAWEVTETDVDELDVLIPDVTQDLVCALEHPSSSWPAEHFHPVPLLGRWVRQSLGPRVRAASGRLVSQNVRRSGFPAVSRVFLWCYAPPPAASGSDSCSSQVGRCSQSSGLQAVPIADGTV